MKFIGTNDKRRRGFVVTVAAVSLALLASSGGLVTNSAQAATVTCDAKTPAASLPVLRSGDNGSCVVYLQSRLDVNKFPVAGADGDFDTPTLTAVKQFQVAKKLDPDSIVGTLTWAALRGTTAYNKGRGPNATKRVILTYDDCPKTLAAFNAMVKSARANNIGLVLAPTGNCLTSFKARYGKKKGDIALIARKNGQYVINHSVTHPDLTKLKYADVVKELKAPGVVTNYGRPPFGATNKTVDRAYADVDMKVWTWTVDTNDWRGGKKKPKSAAIVKYVVAKAKASDTVLMHMQHNGFNPTTMLQIRAGLKEKKILLCRAHKDTAPKNLPAELPC